MRFTFGFSAILLTIVCGCGAGDAGSKASAPTGAADVHDHPSEGPHHGTLVELGKEEFHAEVVHATDSVTVYVLDSHAEMPVPIDATELVINVVHEGKPEQFKLLASPQADDTTGKSSRFTIADAELAAHIDDSAAAPKLSVTINGKAYRGDIHHDHSGHTHSH